MAIRGSIGLKMLIFVLLITVFLFFARKSSIVKQPETSLKSSETSDKVLISVDVYYEALCPDSRDFIIHQLGPTWERLNEIMDLSLVPYGKATSRKTSNGYAFDCQHGPPECEANKYHACAVKQLDNKQSVPLVVCLMEHNRNTKGALGKCSSKVGISSVDIETCATGEEGDKLLYVFGELTHNLSPAVYFIPTIEIDKSQKRFKVALRDLESQVCQEYLDKTGSAHPKCQTP